eukprot:gene10049-10205_t
MQTPSNVRLLAGILSRSNNSVVREAIRDTWGKDEQLAAVMFFVLRPRLNASFNALREEAVVRQDVFVISSEFEDSPGSSALATLEMMKIAYVMPGITHLLKTDEGCFVRVGDLLDAIESSPSKLLYGGYRISMANDPEQPAPIASHKVAVNGQVKTDTSLTALSIMRNGHQAPPKTTVNQQTF